MGNASATPQVDDVIIRCVKPDTKLLEDAGATGFSRADKYEDDLHTSKRLLTSCSPVFQTLLEKSGSKEHQILVVDKFNRDDMALFLRFAAVYASPLEGSAGSSRFQVNMNRNSVQTIMPIAHLYSCEGLWNNLMAWIESKPDLALLVKAEQCSGSSIEWKQPVYRAIMDEIMTEPLSSEVINVKNGHFRRLETGMEIMPAKMDLLGQLTSPTLVKLLKVLVEEKVNAHHEPPAEATPQKA